MPTYDYECERCGRTFEARQRISEPPLTACQHCGGPVHRLLSAAPFILRGDGWYVTDYPSEGRKKALAEEKSGSGAGDRGSGTEDRGSGAGDRGPETEKKPSATPSEKP